MIKCFVSGVPFGVVAPRQVLSGKGLLIGFLRASVGKKGLEQSEKSEFLFLDKQGRPVICPAGQDGGFWQAALQTATSFYVTPPV